jgi:hypothetical protein
MRRTPAAFLAAGLCVMLLATPLQAAGEGSSPFPVLTSELRPPARSHKWAYTAMVGGAALIGASFYFHSRADDAYDDYLAATDPETIERHYDDAARWDTVSRASLTTGEVLLATGLYLRFVRRPAASRTSVILSPNRCALAVNF